MCVYGITNSSWSAVLLLNSILITHSQLPSGLVAHLAEQWWSIPEDVGLSPTGIRDFLIYFQLCPFPF